jgi:vacuolar-type H+-ATPase subunit I/STV1
MANKQLKPKLNKLDKKTEKVFREGEVGVLLENINDNIKLVAEGHLDLERKIDNLSEELNGRIDSLESELGGRIDSLKSKLGGRIDSLEQEMKSSFKTVFDYLSAIDIELSEIKARLENKADKKDLVVIEKRVTKLELELSECKKMIAAAKNS